MHTCINCVLVNACHREEEKEGERHGERRRNERRRERASISCLWEPFTRSWCIAQVKTYASIITGPIIYQILNSYFNTYIIFMCRFVYLHVYIIYASHASYLVLLVLYYYPSRSSSSVYTISLICIWLSSIFLISYLLYISITYGGN